MSLWNSTREDRVREFNEAGGGKTFDEGGSLGLQVVCFDEELREFNEALVDYTLDPSDENRAKMIKEWADVQVTLSNFAWFFKFNGQVAFTRVADNNMTKVVDGKLLKREDGKILKPEGYVKPDMKGL